MGYIFPIIMTAMHLHEMGAQTHAGFIFTFISLVMIYLLRKVDVWLASELSKKWEHVPCHIVLKLHCPALIELVLQYHFFINELQQNYEHNHI